jgi:exonuclease SbcD
LDRPKTQPQLLILHHLAGVFEESGSEQVISLSGVDSIPTDILKKFDYVALGHIHKPQRVADHVYYSGSPIPLRFSETLKKSVVIIEKNEQSLVPRLLNIPSFRDLITIKTNEKDYVRELEKIVPKSTLKPMVEVQIHLTSPVTGLVDEIKSILDKKGCELLSFIPLYFPETIKKEKSNQLFRMSTLELFDEFYKAKYPEADSVPDELKKDFSTLVEKVKNATPTS